jgi:hypothetical protein
MITLRRLPSGHLSAWHEGKLLPVAITSSWLNGNIELVLPVGKFGLGGNVDQRELTDQPSLDAALAFADLPEG